MTQQRGTVELSGLCAQTRCQCHNCNIGLAPLHRILKSKPINSPHEHSRTLQCYFQNGGGKYSITSQQNVFLVEQCLLLPTGHPLIHVPKSIPCSKQRDHSTA